MEYNHRLLLLLLLPLLVSCGTKSDTAILWTDRPEFALYTEYFNSSQDQYKIETRYFESPARKLTEEEGLPDIVVGNWLKSASTRNLFRPLDYLLKNGDIPKDAFYSSLLALGNIDGKQYLLPVAFNIPALVFSEDNGAILSNPFTISLEEIKERGKEYNIENNGVFTRMGFSPSWDDEFLFLTATLFGASFREASPLAWDSRALDQAMTWIQDWTLEANGGIQAEDDFSFKYFYEPPAKLALSGRILFFYMQSSGLFTLPLERRFSLDFRWIAENDSIPLSEDTVYYGIYRNSKALKAADAFTQWFFQEDTQRLFLEAGRNYRLNETLFGIANGFSALRTVTEQIFPQYYPSLLGHMPPESFLSPSNILPRNWMTIKKRVIFPYIRARTRSSDPRDVRSLDQWLTEWVRLNRGL
jgi:ABC-type glycerol-3-phosphate transport system substrate-binding protein